MENCWEGYLGVRVHAQLSRNSYKEESKVVSSIEQILCLDGSQAALKPVANKSEMYFKRAISQKSAFSLQITAPASCGGRSHEQILDDRSAGKLATPAPSFLHKMVKGLLPPSLRWAGYSGLGRCVPAAGSGATLMTVFCSVLALRPAPVYTRAALGRENHRWVIYILVTTCWP